MKSLKQATRDHIEKQQLTDTQMQQLLNLQQPRPGRLSWFLLSGMAACILLTATIALQWLAPRQDMLQLIADEVVKNHIKMKPLEVKTESLKDIRHYFTQLEFSPLHSSHYDRQRLTMLGGRYCSIQGITAAQLRFETESGHLQTLYETFFDREVFGQVPDIGKGEPPAIIYAKGLQVSIWVEKGLLMALVEQEAD